MRVSQRMPLISDATWRTPDREVGGGRGGSGSFRKVPANHQATLISSRVGAGRDASSAGAKEVGWVSLIVRARAPTMTPGHSRTLTVTRSSTAAVGAPPPRVPGQDRLLVGGGVRRYGPPTAVEGLKVSKPWFQPTRRAMWPDHVVEQARQSFRRREDDGHGLPHGSDSPSSRRTYPASTPLVGLPVALTPVTPLRLPRVHEVVGGDRTPSDHTAFGLITYWDGERRRRGRLDAQQQIGVGPGDQLRGDHVRRWGAPKRATPECPRSLRRGVGIEPATRAVELDGRRAPGGGHELRVAVVHRLMRWTPGGRPRATPR